MSTFSIYARALARRVIFGKPPAPQESALIPMEESSINDGLTYAMPTLLPGYLRAALEQHGLMEQYLEESYRQTYNFPFDAPAVRDTAFMGVADDPLLEVNQATRVYILSNCHSVYQRNPLAKRIVNYISAFVIGTGFNLHCKNKDVERVLQAFIDSPDNRFREYERQAVCDLVVDGELFLRFFGDKPPALPDGEIADGSADEAPQPSGQVVCVPIRPWEIESIETEEGFFRRPTTYKWQKYGKHNPDSVEAETKKYKEDIPAKEIIHVAINRHAYELRGRSELYPALPWFKAYKDWLENRARQNHHRGKLLWHVKIKGALANVIAAKVLQYSKPITSGSVVVTGDQEEWQAMVNPIGAGDAGEDGRQIKIMALNGAGGLPEYMTGDGENANLATTKSQQLPVMTTFAMFQVIMIEQVLYPTFRRVIAAAIEAGELEAECELQDADGEPVMVDVEATEAFPFDQQPDQEQPDQEQPMPMPPPLPEPPTQKKAPKLNTLTESFTVDYEPLKDGDPHTLAQALQIAVDKGWASNETASTEMGYDYTIEQKKIAAEDAALVRKQAKGLAAQDPSFAPTGMQDDEDEPEEAIA